MNNIWLTHYGYGQALAARALAVAQADKPNDWLNGILHIWV
jgi:hypothetical protein